MLSFNTEIQTSIAFEDNRFPIRSFQTSSVKSSSMYKESSTDDLVRVQSVVKLEAHVKGIQRSKHNLNERQIFTQVYPNNLSEMKELLSILSKTTKHIEIDQFKQQFCFRP